MGQFFNILESLLNEDFIPGSTEAGNVTQGTNTATNTANQANSVTTAQQGTAHPEVDLSSYLNIDLNDFLPETDSSGNTISGNVTANQDKVVGAIGNIVSSMFNNIIKDPNDSQSIENNALNAVKNLEQQFHLSDDELKGIGNALLSSFMSQMNSVNSNLGGNNGSGNDAVPPQGDSRTNAQKIKASLINELKWQPYQADAFLAVIRGEAQFLPGAINRQEKSGRYPDSSVNYDGRGTEKPNRPHGPYSYGAGICQWSGWDRKLKVLQSIGKDEKWLMNITVGDNSAGPGGIEGCNIDEQIKMVINELNGMSNLVQAVRSTENATQAFYIIYANYIAGYSNRNVDLNNIQQQAEAIAAKYNRINGGNAIQKRLKNISVMQDIQPLKDYNVDNAIAASNKTATQQNKAQA